jgi:hypothetical protein
VYIIRLSTPFQTHVSSRIRPLSGLTMSSPSLSLPAFQGSTVRVSVLRGGRTTLPTAYVVQKQIPGHDLLDIPCYSFLIENEKLGKKALYDLGIMKAWKEKQSPVSEYCTV